MACGWRDGVLRAAGLWCARAVAWVFFPPTAPVFSFKRAGGRSGLENRSGRKATVGSNPTLSAILFSKTTCRGGHVPASFYFQAPEATWWAYRQPPADFEQFHGVPEPLRDCPRVAARDATRPRVARRGRMPRQFRP